MLQLLWLIPALPLAAFVLLAFFGGGMKGRVAGIIATSAAGISALIAMLLGFRLAATSQAEPFRQVLWTWLSVAGLQPEIAFYLDSLSAVMMCVIGLVSFLILLYSIHFMSGEEGYSRFFCYMSLFVGSMLTLVLADNLLLLYLGWEGVGLCSYLLIGFWYKNPANGRAAIKAFVVTRIGDASLLVGIILLATGLGTFEIQDLAARAGAQWGVGSGMAVAAAALLLGGAVGKSAQLPLQTWLPDAMAGPTPVSALIHAATMVTAGVYLLARMHALMALAPAVQLAVAVIGTVTLLYAGLAALAQRDIKRVLAYSTISQVGYMFLALGVGAWSAAVFHFMTHAFFKSLLFLAAGVVILALHHEQDMFKMGGLRRKLPGTFWAFLIGAASLSALPLVTAGFYSKGLILQSAWNSPSGVWLWAGGLAGALLTSLYAFRMVFLTFFGESYGEVEVKRSLCATIPLIVLSILSIAAGFVMPLRGAALAPARMLEVIAGAVSVFGICAAYLIFLARRRVDALTRTLAGSLAHHFLAAGMGFDRLYDTLLVRPYSRLTRLIRGDVVNVLTVVIEEISFLLHDMLSLTQNGRLRWYAAGIAFGAALIIRIVVF